MFRALTLATLVVVWPGAASGQTLSVLHVKVTLTDAARAAMPVPGHALLISDNPATSTPRRVVTAADGTVTVRLRPGSYTVESDEPLAFGGKSYQWTETVEIAAGRDLVLELTAENAEIGAAPAPAASPSSLSASKENAPSLLLPQWKDSVVAVWTPRSRASGFVVDGAGLVVTSQRVIGGASAVEVQLSPSVKVAARILVADRARDVAVLWIAPATTASVRPVQLDCAGGSKPSFVNGQKVVAIGAPLRGQKELSVGNMVRIQPHASVADFRLASGSMGGPVFNTVGSVVGLSSVVDDEDERRSTDARIVPLDDVCQVMGSAEKAMQTAQRPLDTLRPVEPTRPFPVEALEAAAQRRQGNPSPYQMSTSDFDVVFLTPVSIWGAQHNTQDATTRAGRTRGPDLQQGRLAAATDFGDWSDYFSDAPPVLVIRVTPKLAESFWTTVARGAAYTQGVALPAFKHFKPGFSRLRVFCGDAEVTPIHPFTLDQRVSETDAVREGLYVFDPQALGPQCKTVKLGLSSEKDPEKQDTRPVDPPMIERIWQDFASYRALGAAHGDGRP